MYKVYLLKDKKLHRLYKNGKKFFPFLDIIKIYFFIEIISIYSFLRKRYR